MFNKAPIFVQPKYADFADIFFRNLAAKLLEHTKINNHVIDLVLGQQSPYRLIYSLKSIELEILITYIKINVANGFIRLSKSLAGTLILFVIKPNGSLRLYIDY